ncbi:hypothetical protein BBJ28_00000886 [Nothophytophthora sp. Chile5]|nr:hypothetical protein BBJ28_00000886 [Nothophytophthora sp. Chile5]
MESGGGNSPVQASAPPLISAGPSLRSLDQHSRPQPEAKAEVLGAPRQAEDNNQEDDSVHSPLGRHVGALVGQGSTISTLQHGEQQLNSDNNELQRLRKENAALLHRLKHLETQHDQCVTHLQTQLQQTTEAHREAERRLNTQLQRLRSEQQAAVDNARKMRAVLARVSNWLVYGGPVLASTATNDESEAAPSNNTPTTKGSATGLLAYCAQLVTTSLSASLSASLSSPSPNSKVMPAWILDPFSPVREPVFDQELGQWCGERSKERREINVAVPNLALGLL